MDFAEVVRRRRMVRSFADRPLPPGLLDRLLATATRAPSAGFAQGPRFLTLEDAEARARFWALTAPPAGGRPDPWPGLRRAPAVVLPLASPEPYLARYAEPDKVGQGRDRVEGWPVPYWQVDCAFATMLLLLAAADAGLGAAFVGLFHGEDAVLAELGVPAGWRPIGAVALGHPAADDRPSRSTGRGRRPLDEVVHRERW